MMTDQIHEINSYNIKIINNIIDSISIYLDEIQNNPRSLDKRNQSGAAIRWRDEFITCKENLNESISALEVNYQQMIWVKSRSDELFLRAENFLNTLPQSSNNSVIVSAWNEIKQNSTSNDAIIKQYGKIWEKKYNTDTKELPELFANIPRLIRLYNSSVAKAEINQTSNYHAMGPLENIIRSLFQDNALAQDLRSHVLSFRFQSIKIDPSSYDNLKLKMS